MRSHTLTTYDRISYRAAILTPMTGLAGICAIVVCANMETKMKGIHGRFVLALLAMGILCSVGLGRTVDFELVPLETTYGSPVPHLPGDVVLSQGGIDMSVENFQLGAFTDFNFAEVAGVPGPPVSFFPPVINPTQTLTINSINTKFDFANVGFPVDYVRFDYVDLGGEENFEVNATGLHEVTDLISLPSFPGPNHALNVTANPIAGGTEGSLWVFNDIQTMLVGGQELGIDNVNACQLGDFDCDNAVDASDIDLLRPEIIAVSDDPLFDLNNAHLGIVGASDLDFMVETVFGTFFGDADLNKVVNFNDFVPPPTMSEVLPRAGPRATSIWTF